MAQENVKKRWVEQGIWNDKWDQFAAGRWKHEEPLESELSTPSAAESSPPVLLFSKQRQPKPRRPKSEDDERQIIKRQVVRAREREASRPYHQFIYQISRERERIQDELRVGRSAPVSIADINSRAYENVKNTWTKRGIWNNRWGILPGMSWKHEEPLEEDTTDDPAPQANPVENGNHEAPIMPMNEAPLGNILGHPVSQVSGVTNTYQPRPPADIGSAGLESGGTEHPPSTSNPPHYRTGKRNLRPPKRQASHPSKNIPSHKAGQPQPVAVASLGPAHPLKVSKPTVNKRPRQQQLNASRVAPSGILPLFSGKVAADNVTVRSSQRVEKYASSVAEDQDPSKGAVRSKPEQRVASNVTTRSAGKPRGISKRKTTQTTRRKAKERVTN
jgi:hypothetical protein